VTKNICESVTVVALYIRESFEKFVDWRQCVPVTQRAVTIMSNCSGGGNVVVA
jgi:hypothetical protein